MSRDLEKQTEQVRQDLAVCLKQTMPARQFRATMILALVGLHMTAARIKKTDNLKERRQLRNEFNRRKDAIEKGVKLLKQRKGRRSEYSRAGLCQAMH